MRARPPLTVPPKPQKVSGADPVASVPPGIVKSCINSMHVRGGGMRKITKRDMAFALVAWLVGALVAVAIMVVVAQSLMVNGM